MPLIRIQHYPNFRQVFVADTNLISHMSVVEISTFSPNYVTLGTDSASGLVCGVAWGAQSGSVSGKVVEIVTQGIASGVVCASSINAGDRVMAASGGRIAAFNTITPAGYPIVSGGGVISGLLASGTMASGTVGEGGFSGFITSGYARINISGAFVGTPFINARILGKALASGGGAGSGIPILVTLGG